jgi:hypothetical protein
VREFTLEMKQFARELHKDSIGEFTFMPVMAQLREGDDGPFSGPST